ncbi:OmpA/MotB domain protein [Chloroherpeton thalassium ATCC 35110]|uniref:OmpA/MotB domain protein n=1 Tax=Chloroherpeton thalassium (strain ATCC 35110 / GB-78) TaxID=517418 RepID=B3QUD6_CHLT3|nr:OmpA family protein [Chloroherpeton thalassium]ACF14385.1 OmpA/MotB domain protein [Chloroherpeton thalassium ATCC 35110]
MKNLLISILVLAFSVLSPLSSHAQLFDYVKKKADKAADKAVETGAEEVVQSVLNKDDEDANDENNQAASGQSETASASKTPSLNWASYDFVPGDEVIFDDAPSQTEQNGEFPSHWDLKGGSVEIAEVDGEKVIMLRGSKSQIVPYIKDSNKDYLPEVFTIEFDLYIPANANPAYVFLWDRKNQRKPSQMSTLTISYNSISYKSNKSAYPKKINRKEGHWIHVAIAYTQGKLKAYFDDVRLLNIPHLDAEPTGMTIQCYNASDEKAYFLKNVRIAKGGVKYYDRVLTDGKIVVNGIKFDVGKATLRPESIGPINEIYSLMKAHADIKFSVEGHTDSDGDASSNQTLSEQRAKSVMDELIRMGISADRLKFKGFGESKPVDTNDTPEGKANNRRVEFVKM